MVLFWLLRDGSCVFGSWCMYGCVFLYSCLDGWILVLFVFGCFLRCLHVIVILGFPGLVWFEVVVVL